MVDSGQALALAVSGRREGRCGIVAVWEVTRIWEWESDDEE